MLARARCPNGTARRNPPRQAPIDATAANARQARPLANHSRTRRRSEHAPACAVGPAANPHLSVRAGRGLLERHKFRVAHDPTLAGHGNPVGRFAVVIAATPLAGRISICAAIDPGIVSRPGRYRCQGPNEREPEDRDPARRSMRARTHGTARKLRRGGGEVRSAVQDMVAVHRPLASLCCHWCALAVSCRHREPRSASPASAMQLLSGSKRKVAAANWRSEHVPFCRAAVARAWRRDQRH